LLGHFPRSFEITAAGEIARRIDGDGLWGN
jgi:hypothetical protein